MGLDRRRSKPDQPRERPRRRRPRAARRSAAFRMWPGTSPTASVLRDPRRRADATGTAWEQVVGGDAPVDGTRRRQAFNGPSPVAIGGVPYLAWEESDGDEPRDPRRSSGARLPRAQRDGEPDVGLADGRGPYVRCFSAAGRVRARPQRADSQRRRHLVTAQSGNGDSALVTQPIADLQPATAYDWRAFATDTVRRTATERDAQPSRREPLAAARRPPAAPSGPRRPTCSPRQIISASLSRRRSAVDRRGAPEVRIAQRRSRRAPRGTTFRYTLSESRAGRVPHRPQDRPGRRARGRCRRPTRANRGRP